MAGTFIHAALVATAQPWPWSGGQLVAFTGGDAYLNQQPQDPITQQQQTAATTDRLADALPVPMAPVSPGIGGFSPFDLAAAGAAIARDAQAIGSKVLALVSQIWGALNGRTIIPGHDAQYERGAPQGNWDPTGTNRFRVWVFGRRYAGSFLDCPGGINAGELVNEARSPWVEIPDGGLLTLGDEPPSFVAPYTSVHIYSGDLFLYVPGAHGGTDLWNFARIGGLAVSSVVQVQVEPVEGPGVPYPATVPALPPAPDPLALFPKVPDPEPLPVADPTAPVRRRPAVLPPDPLQPAPALPPVVPDAQPITQPAPDGTGISRTLTTITGALVGAAAASRPRIAPMPAGPIPGLEPWMKPNGKPVQKPAPAPITTPTDARQYGATTITSGAPATSPQAVANEIGRIEQKLGLLMPLAGKDPSWLDSLRDSLQDAIVQELVKKLLGDDGTSGSADLPETVYRFTPPYDTPGSGLADSAEYEIPADKLGPALVARLDAIAEALQLIAPWRVKLSKGNLVSSNITITAYGTPDP